MSVTSNSPTVQPSVTWKGLDHWPWATHSQRRLGEKEILARETLAGKLALLLESA